MAHLNRIDMTRRRMAAALAALLALALAAPAADAQKSASASASGSAQAASKRAASARASQLKLRKKVDWPDGKKARRALSPRNFKKNIVDPALKEAEIVAVDNGREPFAIEGKFGIVFKIQASPRRQIAFRAFLPENPTQQAQLEAGLIQRRYKRLERKFAALGKKGQLPPELIDFEYVARGFKSGNRVFPATKFPWLTGRTLDAWVAGRLQAGKPEALRIQAKNFRLAMRDLGKAGLAHGDLRDANILVEGDGQMRFVDYDAMYADEIADDGNSELGQENYQHPAYHLRNPDQKRKRTYGKKLDHFSSIVIYLSLLAVAEDPGLYDDFNDDNQLIFDQEDLNDPDSSAVFARLEQSPNSAVRQLATKLKGYAKGDPDAVPSLEQAISGRSKQPARDAFGKRETGGIMTDDLLVSENGGDPQLVTRTLGVRSKRALGSARTAEEYDENGPSIEIGGADPLAKRVTRSGGSRGSVRASGAARARAADFDTVVPTINGALPRVSSGNPGLLLLLTDTSSSMAGQFADQAGITKQAALAEVVNTTLGDLVGRFRSGDRIKDTMDVSAFSYGGSVFDSLGGLKTLPELSQNVRRIDDTVDENGEPLSLPVWVEPRASGGTPMNGGFSQVRSNLGQWRQKRNPTKEHLVLGVHVTDGEFTDSDPTSQISALAQDVERQGGKLLMTNIHLSSVGGVDDGVIFPTEADAAKFDRFGQNLFRWSSVIPEPLRQKLNRGGRNIKKGARMMAYNANLDDLAFLFESGSSTAIE